MGKTLNEICTLQSHLALLKKYLYTIVIAFAFSKLFHPVWAENLELFHTIIELCCIFTGLLIFLTVWATYQHHGFTHYVLSFGFLCIALFDIFHTIFFLRQNLSEESYFDISTWLWILGRVTEASILFLSAKNCKTILNKWMAFAITLAVAGGAILFAYYHHDYLPRLLTSKGITALKVVLEYIIMGIYIISFFRIKKGYTHIESITRQYILAAIMFSVSAEFAFTLYTSVQSMTMAFGHILKMLSYYHLMRGIFMSTIVYPYEKLAKEHQLLEEQNKSILENQEKLVQQEKLALLGQMGAGIVHETRNYLTTIKGYSQMIYYKTEDEKIKKYATSIDKNVDEVNNILSEFLFLAKPKSIQLAKGSLSKIFSDIESIVQTSSIMKGIPVEFNFPYTNRKVLCDERQLKQVILNLCKNAVEAMADTKEAKLKIETGCLDKQKEMYIKIIDNGKGMTEETLKRIGTPFYTTKKTGTGLGLSVCYKIIESHNGRITVDSAPNKGTTFTLYLPTVNE